MSNVAEHGDNAGRGILEVCDLLGNGGQYRCFAQVSGRRYRQAVLAQSDDRERAVDQEMPILCPEAQGIRGGSGRTVDPSRSVQEVPIDVVRPQ